MSRPPSAYVAERNARLIADFKAGITSSMELSLRHGIGEAYVDRLLRQAGLVSRSNRRRRVSVEVRKPLSNLCAAVGAVLEHAILEVELEGGRRPTGEDFNWNVAMHRNILRGLHPITLLDLEKIARWMKIPVSELLRRAENRSVIHTRNTGSSA
jgi:hypothetical protein